VLVIVGLEHLGIVQLIALPSVVILEQSEVDGGIPVVVGAVMVEQDTAEVDIIVRPLREEMLLVMVLLTLLLLATATGVIIL
jgi:hypothetical protein